MESNYMQIIEQTDKEKLVMYMKCKKKELAKMLIQCNKIIDDNVKPMASYIQSNIVLCPNCKEPVGNCACMRNICIKCGKPVGNITFTVCDECWDVKPPLKD